MNYQYFCMIAALLALNGCKSSAPDAIDCSDVALTPGGPRARACVHEVPNGAQVEATPDGGSIVRLNGAIVATYPPCPCTAGTSGIPTGPSAGASATPGAQCSISAAHYDQSCSSDTDCNLVYEGDVCSSTCRCPNAAIRGDAQAAYDADISRSSMSGPSTCFCPCNGGPRCVNGACELARCGS